MPLVGSGNLFALNVLSAQSEKAVFGEVSWDITGQLNATAGLRASRTSVGFDTTAGGISGDRLLLADQHFLGR